MSEKKNVALAQEPAGDEKPGIAPRIFALSALTAVGGSLLWLAIAIVRVFSDSWIAPISLSPDSDAVLQMDLQLTRERAEMQRVSAEIARIDAEVEAIDEGIERLGALRNTSDEVFTYGADESSLEAASLTRTIRNLQSERTILGRLIERQQHEVELAQQHLAAGLIERRDLEAQEQTLDSLELQRIANARAIDEAETLRHEASTSAAQLRSSAHGAATGAATDAVMPEIVARHEADARLEVEIVRLEAERRGLVAMRAMGQQSLDELNEVMGEIEARPLYQATQRQMDVAFVPYEQLGGVSVGHELIRCHAGIFFCEHVGTIREVMPGEVVTQDPWGELARGRYAVLQLDDPSAVEERILRVR
jgi:hypothetical protein